MTRDIVHPVTCPMYSIFFFNTSSRPVPREGTSPVLSNCCTLPRASRHAQSHNVTWATTTHKRTTSDHKLSVLTPSKLMKFECGLSIRCRKFRCSLSSITTQYDSLAPAESYCNDHMGADAETFIFPLGQGSFRIIPPCHSVEVPAQTK